MTTKTCSVETNGKPCGKPTIAHGLCTTHYKRWKRKGDVQADMVVIGKNGERPECRLDGCHNPVVSAKNLVCQKHDYNMKKYGTYERPPRGGNRSLCQAGCGRPVASHGWCMGHWRRVQTYRKAYPEVPFGDVEALHRAVAKDVRDREGLAL
jgi:hypothetical protein